MSKAKEQSGAKDRRPLTDIKIRNLKEPGKYSDHGRNGLYVYVSGTGCKSFRMAYLFKGKRKDITFGKYPAMTLNEARQKAIEARTLLERGIDPGEAKKEAKAADRRQAAEEAQTFRAVALEWFAKHKVSESTRTRMRSWLEKELFPAIGSVPVARLERLQILEAVRRVAARGSVETARRIVWMVSQVMRYGRNCGYCKDNPADGLTEALPVPEGKHYPAILDRQKIGRLLLAIDEYSGDASTWYALRLLPLVFTRSQELRGARWEEFDLDAGMWEIPGSRMKMKRPHLVPLSKQALAILHEMEVYRRGDLLFPSRVSAAKPITGACLEKALERILENSGEEEKMVPHSFRKVASTFLNEGLDGRLFRYDVIEAQLAHGEKNPIRGAYNEATYIPERKEMMAAWGAYLDKLKAAAKGAVKK